MGISREEQLLNELLRDVRQADLQLDAASLEARVVGAFPAAAPVGRHVVQRRKAGIALCVAAAGVVLGVVFAPQQPEPVPLPVVRPPVHAIAAMNRAVEFPDHLMAAKSPAPRRPDTRPSTAQPSMEFVPLVPLSERELTGSFQLVRVQMPRASLGALTSPFEHPDEVVEADVLLGEDGMARAIRVSTKGSAYPWRPR
jgi:hypothetical protein